MFPVRSRVVRYTVPTYLGEEEVAPPQQIVAQESPPPQQVVAAGPSHEQLEQQAADQAAAAEQRMKAIEKRLAKEVKREMIKTAAAQASISIALAFVPIVGPLLSLAASVLFAADARKYKKQMEAEAKKAEDTLRAEAEKMGRDLEDASLVIFREEMPVVHAQLVAEATGTAPPSVEGFLGLGRSLRKSVKRVTKDVKRTVSKVEDEVKRVGAQAQDQFDTIRGKAGVEALRKRLAEMVAQARKDMAEQKATALALIGTPEHRQKVREQIRMELLSDPEYAAELAALRQASAISPAVGADAARRAAARGGNIGGIALIGGAAIAAILLMR
jgi:ABC-type transporter MlaC component